MATAAGPGRCPAAPSSPIKYLRRHHPDIALAETDRPVDPGAEIPAEFLTFERVEPLFAESRKPLRDFALELARWEFARWSPPADELVAAGRESRTPTSGGSWPRPSWPTTRPSTAATGSTPRSLGPAAVYRFCESADESTRELGMQLIGRSPRLRLPEELFRLTESPDRQVRGVRDPGALVALPRPRDHRRLEAVRAARADGRRRGEEGRAARPRAGARRRRPGPSTLPAEPREPLALPPADPVRDPARPAREARRTRRTERPSGSSRCPPGRRSWPWSRRCATWPWKTPTSPAASCRCWRSSWPRGARASRPPAWWPSPGSATPIPSSAADGEGGGPREHRREVSSPIAATSRRSSGSAARSPSSPSTPRAGHAASTGSTPTRSRSRCRPAPGGGLGARRPTARRSGSAGGDGQVYRGSASGGKPKPLGAGARRARRRPWPCWPTDGSAVLVGSRVVILSRKDGKALQTLDLPEPGTCLAADPTGRWLAAGTAQGDRRGLRRRGEARVPAERLGAAARGGRHRAPVRARRAPVLLGGGRPEAPLDPRPGQARARGQGRGATTTPTSSRR